MDLGLGKSESCLLSFLTGHPNYRDQFKDLKWEQLAEVLPILPEYGALELKTHPELGTREWIAIFVGSGFFRNRPLPQGDRNPR